MQSDIRIDGRVFTYVFPCAWEDYAKIGFSRDPLGRISALHRRWFEFFDLDAGALVEAEGERDARDLELQLRSPFKAHRAPAPMTIQHKAGVVLNGYVVPTRPCRWQLLRWVNKAIAVTR